MKIRRASPADASGLSSLMKELMGVPSSLDALKKTLQSITADSSYHLLVAEQDGCLLGTAMGVLCYDIYRECLPFVVIENVIVSEKSRGLGVGTQLFSALEEWAEKNQASYCMLVSGNERTGAHRFYAALGYQQMFGFRKYL